MKKQVIEKIFLNYIFNKGFIFMLYKEFLQFNISKTNNAI